MTTTEHADQTEFADAADTLKPLLERLRQRLAAPEAAEGTLVRVESRIAPLAPVEWLHAQRNQSHYYWSSRDGGFEMAGLGEADVLVPEARVDMPGVFAHMRSRLSIEWPNLRYYGGFRFQESQEPGGRWRNFKAYRFIAPRVEVVRHEQKFWFALTVRKDTPEANEAALEVMEATLNGISFSDSPPPCPLPPIIGRTDLPDRAQWDALIDKALEAIAGHDMEKVVLARETEFHFDTDEPLDAICVLRRLQQHSSKSFEFCFQPSATRAFIGASPERLFYRNNVYLQSEALAGTRPRGATDEADAELGEDLLNDDKELREHRFVVRMLRENFTRFCSSMSYDLAPSLMPLRNVQHLYSYIEGILKVREADAPLLEAFHPTPAVGGVPRAKALAWLAENEPFDRGVYAAPVGWVGFDDAEFCVGIRSGLIEGNTLSLYSGAGIVPGSSAEAEWDEIESKMSNFLEALQDGPG